jgi:hypothetical protein
MGKGIAVGGRIINVPSTSQLALLKAMARIGKPALAPVIASETDGLVNDGTAYVNLARLGKSGHTRRIEQSTEIGGVEIKRVLHELTEDGRLVVQLTEISGIGREGTSAAA